ncbi:MAG: DUF1775 domain-containing protein [Candidatus Tectomicrobia bacterium]|uniref:DUF1775 domain-containing protein n=1 Tax=Tectimicrobiota bacterium TaxID=2528274 RepID=A0A937W4X5_UNCTE|nr:DUF1775 domain-containing protein [Candidatus Tectomicrobia bacterium]
MHTPGWWQHRRWIGSGLASLILLAATAWGHSDLDPRQSIPSKWETYTVNVPTETESPTVQVRLLVPREFEVEMVGHTPLWQIAKTRDERGYVKDVTWSGSTIPSQTFAEFKLLIRNPSTPGTYRWKIEQGYQDGTVATWDAQTQIVPVASAGGIQRAEEAWRAAQVATTVSLVALGIAIVLILVTALGIVRSARAPAREEQA